MSGVYVTVFFDDLAAVRVSHYNERPFASITLQTRAGLVSITEVPRAHADTIAKAFSDAMTPDEPLQERRQPESEAAL